MIDGAKIDDGAKRPVDFAARPTTMSDAVALWEEADFVAVPTWSVLECFDDDPAEDFFVSGVILIWCFEVRNVPPKRRESSNICEARANSSIDSGEPAHS
jgi:hypothetical protein